MKSMAWFFELGTGKPAVNYVERYLFSATFWHLKNAEQHVCRFLAHPNVLLQGF